MKLIQRWNEMEAESSHEIECAHLSDLEFALVFEPLLLLICELPEDELQTGSVTKPCPKGAFSVCGYISTKEKFETY